MEENRDYDERREYRRKRRIRNQIIAYITVVLFFAAIVAGAFFGIRAITSKVSEKQQAEELAKQLEQISAEEAVVEPPVIETEEQEPEEEVDWLEEMVEASISEMPLEDRVAGLFMITPEALTGVDKAIRAGEGTREALNKYAVGGLVYFSQNITDKEQLMEMLTNTRSMSKYPIFLAVDEEGGTVRRVGDSSIEVEEVGNMSDIGAAGDVNAAYDSGAVIASYLYELGFNVDFAPVADVVADVENSAIGTRSFGSDPAAVGDMVSSMVSGIQDTGISSCLKHFPGIGAAGEDTHDGMVVIEKSAEELSASELIPFKAGIDAGAHFVMVGHASLPNVIGDNTPCSLSEAMITNTLRGELGYNGIVITDAMNMSAITEYYAADEAAVMALKAGADMILMPENFETAYNGVLAAVQEGVIAEERVNESLKRIYRVKYRDKVDQSGNVVGADETGNEAAEAPDTTEPEETADGAAEAVDGALEGNE